MDVLKRWIRAAGPGWPSWSRVSAWWRSPARPIPIVVLAARGLGARRGTADTNAPSPESALVEALSSRGLTSDVADITWITGPSGVWGAIGGTARAPARAHLADEPSDLYLVDARLSPEGSVLEVGGAWNLTETAGADES